MDLTTTSKEFLKASTLFVSQQEVKMDELSKNTPFLDTFCDPLCKLNLKETSEFVKSLPLAKNDTKVCEQSSKGLSLFTKRNLEAPTTPGRPIFNFSNGNFSRKNCPSKWDDAEKWVVNGSDCASKMYYKQCSGYNKPQVVQEVFAEKSKVTSEEKVSTFQGTFALETHNSTIAVNGVSLSSSKEVFLTDKFPNPKFGCSEPLQEGFLFESAIVKPMNDAPVERVQNVKHKDVGTEMTPLASSTTSRCPTPFKSSSPARHNTPDNRSGPLANSSNSIDVTKLEQFDFGKMHLGSQYDCTMSNWSSREEEEEDVSKSLRHFEISGEFRKSVSDSRCAWEEEEKTKSFLRYEREEAKIEAWVNLQSAKAEAESRKLEVKIQKMKYDLEEKLMKRMADVQRKAEEWRAVAQFNHSEQIRKVNQRARKFTNKNNTHVSVNKSCGCFPCNNHI